MNTLPRIEEKTQCGKLNLARITKNRNIKRRNYNKTNATAHLVSSKSNIREMQMNSRQFICELP